MDTKEKYIDLLIEQLQPSGDVLLFGFGTGYGAKKVMSHYPKSLIIIEKDPTVALKAGQWAKDQKNVKVIEGPWKDNLPLLGIFDAILYCDYPIDCQLQRQTSKITSGADKLVKEAKEEIAKIKTAFSDKELEEFYAAMGHSHPTELPMFFNTLRSHGNISENQYQTITKKYDIKQLPKEMNLEIGYPIDCLDSCLKAHMHKKSKFSCFLLTSNSLYDDVSFFEKIITNPSLNYEESAVTLPSSETVLLNLVTITE